MNFGQAFSFPSQDTDWLKKIGLMGLVSLIPIVGQIIVLGWALEIAKRVIQRNPVLLPEINLGEQLGEGFKGFLVSLAYSLPLILMQIPITVSSIMIDSSQGSSSSDAGVAAFAMVSLCCAGIMVLYGLLLGFTLPAALGNMVAKGNLSAAFDFKAVLGLVRAAPVAYLLVLVGSFLGSFVASLGMIACFIGIIFTYVYYMAVMGNLYGQAYNEAANNSYLGQSAM